MIETSDSVPVGKDAAPRWRRWRRFVIPVNVALLIVLVPFVTHLFAQPIRFNQFQIQRLELRYRTASIGTVLDAFRSAYTSGLNILWRRPGRDAPPRDDPERFFRYVFSWLPSYAVVYPTEGFYYFRVGDDAGGVTSGNLRLAELDRGRITFACFEAGTYGSTETCTIGPSDGLSVEVVSDDTYAVRYGGRTVRFVIRGRSLQATPALAMLPAEQFVGRVYDESGLVFLLLYNEQTNAFYYVLDDAYGINETLDPIEEPYLLGSRTGFVYYDDPQHDRRLLVGLRRSSVEVNDYFDGPGDQVPYWIDLRELLHRSYPSTLVGDGIDAHGVKLGAPVWARFVIAPYHQYGSVSELLELQADRRREPLDDAGRRWTTLTREWWNTPHWRAMIKETLRAEGKLDELPE